MTELQRSPVVQRSLESSTSTLFWPTNIDSTLLQLGLNGLQRLQAERAPKVDEALVVCDEMNRPSSTTASAAAPEGLQTRTLVHTILASPDLQKLLSPISSQEPTVTANITLEKASTAAPLNPADKAPRTPPESDAVHRAAHRTEMETDSGEDTPTSSGCASAAAQSFHKPNGVSAIKASTSFTNASNEASHSNGVTNSLSVYMKEGLEQCRNFMSSLLLENIRLRSASKSNDFLSTPHTAPRNVKDLLSDDVCKAFLEKVGEAKSQLHLREKICDHPHDDRPKGTPASHVDSRRRIEPVVSTGTTTTSSWGKSPQRKYQDDAHPRTARKRSHQSDDESDRNSRASRSWVPEFYDTSASSTAYRDPSRSSSRDLNRRDGSPTRSQHDTRSRSRDTTPRGHLEGKSDGVHHSSPMLIDSVEHRDERRHDANILNDSRHSDRDGEQPQSGEDENWVSQHSLAKPLSAKPSDTDPDSTPHSSILNDTRAPQTPPTSNLDSNQIQSPESSSNACDMPCHNVPGLWFLQPALFSPGVLECKFFIDFETAQKWQIDSEPEEMYSNTSNNPVLRLNLLCLSYENAKTVLFNTPPFPKALADAVWNCSSKEWPEQGTLLIQVNPGQKYGRSWMPADLSPHSPPLDITNSVGLGMNVIRCIQLSPAYSFFILHATTGANPNWKGFEKFLGDSGLRDTGIDVTATSAT
ncbi:hypothetical protein E1B28_011038 [Marasmius oreades]|uniref:Uncharacterized protein n=1 Tax=Marasmius oreades TaxID=181124 RepID=A0A9P7RTX1_9AGAR|nr:uncharacterized protein E1B28_011038 [Marasmius oreades]KAG7089348.1 hypothetical protein E1B28_011038 [Marasmius oreades]